MIGNFGVKRNFYFALYFPKP